MRSLGQAFDVCHKLNPKPQKKKKEVESGSDAPESPKEEGVAKKSKKVEGKEEEEEEMVKEDLGSPTTPGSVPSGWKQFHTDLDATLEGGGGEGVASMDKKIENLSTDLMQLTFDPFGAAPLNMPVANGNPLGGVDPFQPLTMPGGGAVGGDSGAVAYPPLTVSNMSTNLPDFPDGVDPATASASVPPPHLALLGRPRPRPNPSAGQQQQQQQVGKGIVIIVVITSSLRHPIYIRRQIASTHH